MSSHLQLAPDPEAPQENVPVRQRFDALANVAEPGSLAHVVTLADLGVAYFEAQQEVGFHSWIDFESAWRNWVLTGGPAWASMPLDDLKPRHILAWLKATSGVKVSANGKGDGTSSVTENTRRKALSVLCAVLSWACERERLASNPAKGLKSWPSKEDSDGARRDGEILSVAQITYLMHSPLLSYFEQLTSALGYGSGLRRAEIAGLKVGDWDRHDLMLKLQHAVKGKKGQQRIGPLKDSKGQQVFIRPVAPVRRFIDLLEQHAKRWEEIVGRPPRADDPMIPRGDRPTERLGYHLSPEQVAASVRRILVRTGIWPEERKAYRSHAMRHTFAHITADMPGAEITGQYTHKSAVPRDTLHSTYRKRRRIRPSVHRYIMDQYPIDARILELCEEQARQLVAPELSEMKSGDTIVYRRGAGTTLGVLKKRTTATREPSFVIYGASQTVALNRIVACLGKTPDWAGYEDEVLGEFDGSAAHGACDPSSDGDDR